MRIYGERPDPVPAGTRQGLLADGAVQAQLIQPAVGSHPHLAIRGFHQGVAVSARTEIGIIAETRDIAVFPAVESAALGGDDEPPRRSLEHSTEDVGGARRIGIADKKRAYAGVGKPVKPVGGSHPQLPVRRGGNGFHLILRETPGRLQCDETAVPEPAESLTVKRQPYNPVGGGRHPGGRPLELSRERMPCPAIFVPVPKDAVSREPQASLRIDRHRADDRWPVPFIPPPCPLPPLTKGAVRGNTPEAALAVAQHRGDRKGRIRIFRQPLEFFADKPCRSRPRQHHQRTVLILLKALHPIGRQAVSGRVGVLDAAVAEDAQSTAQSPQP